MKGAGFTAAPIFENGRYRRLLGRRVFGVSEVTYYTRDYLDVEEAPLIRCYDAAYTEEEQHYHLLLDDVSITHLEAAQKEPTLEYGLALAEGLGAMHARWWGSQRLAEVHAPMHNANHIQRFVDIAKPAYRAKTRIVHKSI